MKRRIYMDNAATTFPKPPGVMEAMVHFMQNIGANPGRSKHDLSLEASSIVDGTRKKLALLFNIPDPKRIAFTLNATESLNTVIYGVLNPGDHVIITQMEHNSVIRPVRHLEEIGVVSVSVAPCDKMGVLDIGALKELIRDNTALVALNHASNVCGTIQRRCRGQRGCRTSAVCFWTRHRPLERSPSTCRRWASISSRSRGTKDCTGLREPADSTSEKGFPSGR